jgi:hypothetical protein
VRHFTLQLTICILEVFLFRLSIVQLLLVKFLKLLQLLLRKHFPLGFGLVYDDLILEMDLFALLAIFSGSLVSSVSLILEELFLFVLLHNGLLQIVNLFDVLTVVRKRTFSDSLQHLL